MDHVLRELVRQRAKGGDIHSNLALACPDCNASTGPNQSACDPESDALVQLFNPPPDARDFSIKLHRPYTLVESLLVAPLRREWSVAPAACETLAAIPSRSRVYLAVELAALRRMCDAIMRR